MANVDLIEQKGRDFVIFAPATERVIFGFGNDPTPVTFPNVVAYRRVTSRRCATSVRLTAAEGGARNAAYSEALSALGLSEERLQRSSVKRREVHPVMQPDEVGGRYVTGEEALRSISVEDYDIVYPFGIGGLDRRRSAPQLRTDLEHIWLAAVTSCLHLKAADLRSIGVVLLVPDDFALGDIEVMLDVLFVDMAFKEVVVHSNSTAAAFGQGTSGGCIVHMDEGAVTVSCIEDGVLMPDSLHVLPFGGRHISQALHWMTQDAMPSAFCPELHPYDRCQLAALRDAACFLPQECTQAVLENQIQNAASVCASFRSSRQGEGEIRHISVGGAACVAPMGLFFPSLLLPHAVSVAESSRPVSEAFYSEILSDPETTGSSQTAPAARYLAISLDQAIVRSISAAENVEHRRRLYTSILVVGPCSHLKGLPDMLERCVLSALPPDEVIDTVEVIEPKGPSEQMLWKGGVVLGCLSDPWVRREEWTHEGKPNKLGKRDIARSRVYWMFKTETGIVM